MAFNLTPSANKGKLKMESFLSDDVQLTRGEVNIADLIAWENQPFKLYSEEKMQEMMKSIEANGLITPITVRPYGEGKYQILAGHNRAEACRRLEMTTIPATIMNVNDHQAKLVVVDTNLCQRIELLPSERAFAYKMQCEALVALGHCKSTNEVLLNIMAERESNRQKFEELYTESEYIFTHPDGRLYRPDCVTRTFQRILKRHKLPEMRFHDLRHSTASILFDKGWDLEAVKAWLRHADIETTSNIYLHISKDRKHLLAADLQGTCIAPIFENEYDLEISQKRMDA